MRCLGFLSCFFSFLFASEYSIVFVHKGNELPSFLHTAVEQALLFNSEASIYVVGDKQALETYEKTFPDAIHLVAIESLPQTKDHKQFVKRTHFGKGFWRYTIERFFLVEELMNKYELKNVFHLESDNLLYVDLSDLLGVFEKNYQGVAATFDNENRAIAGLIYFSSLPSMRSLNKFIARNAKNEENDMQLLAAYRKKRNPQKIDLLPVISDEYVKKFPLKSQSGEKAKKAECFFNYIEEFASIFDAAAIGQFLGGNDPIHANAHVGFINESALYDPSLFNIVWEKDEKERMVPYAQWDDKKYRINNLHVHSKKLDKFFSKAENFDMAIPVARKGRQFEEKYRKPYLPFVSGDAFRSISDHIYDETHMQFDPTKVQIGDVIFVKGDYLDEFFATYHKNIANPYILISHNADQEVPIGMEVYLNDDKLLVWFAQNVVKKHEKLIPIPIGIENRYWNSKKHKSMLAKRQQIKNSLKHNLLYMNFVLATHKDEREMVKEMFENKTYCKAAFNLPFSDYYQDVVSSDFILCPRGNGIDCHRTWECLYLGSFPVVKSSAMDGLFEDLPVVLIKDWEEVTEELLKKKYQEFASKKFHMEKIFFDYWKFLVQKHKAKAKATFSSCEKTS